MLPPTILILSLGGIIVIVSRAALRMRQEAFTTSIKSAGETVMSGGSVITEGINMPDESDLLKPSQKSVQAIKSRLGLLKIMASKTKIGLASSLSKAKHKMRRQPKDSANSEQPKKSLVERMQSVSTKMTSATGEHLEALRKKAASLKVKRAPKTVEPTPVIASPTPTSVSAAASFKVGRVVASVKKPTIKTKLVTQPETQSASETPVAPTKPEAPAPAPVMTATITTARSILRRHRSVPSILESAQQALSSGEFQKAEDLLVSHIVKHTKDTDAYMLLGQVAIGRKAWEDAIEIFEQVVGWHPQQEGAHAALGHSAYKAGHFSRALPALQRAREADPTDTLVLQELLDIARKMDNRALQHSLQEDLELARNHATAR